MASTFNPSRRDFVKTLGALSAAGSLALGAGARETRKRPPNIILIMADDLGYECIGANGGTSYETPHLDRLAKRGVRFEQCYSQPLCTPSRVKLMTGRYNVRNYVRFGYLDTEEETFGNVLKDSGYATCIAGKWQLNGSRETTPELLNRPRHFGFDEWCLWQVTTNGRIRKDGERLDARYASPRLSINGELRDVMKDEYGPKVCTDHILDFIERKQDQPFFVYYPMILTHCPFTITPDSPEWKDPEKRVASRTYKGDPKYFSDMVAYMDKLVGAIVDKVDELGLSEDTLIMFTGDNGTDQPIVSELNGREVEGGKGRTTDAGTRVPLIASRPGTIPEGRVSRALVDFSDFLPTICEAAGATPPRDRELDGKSFLPVLTGESSEHREWIYCWFSRSGKTEEAKVFARTRRYKLYKSGQFYDVKTDVQEQRPIPESDMGGKEARVRKMLRRVLEQYSEVRPRPDRLN